MEFLKDEKKDFILYRTGWNSAINEVLRILEQKYNTYGNINSIKEDIKKLSNIYENNYGIKEYKCEILKYYESKDYGYIILNCIDKIEGYYLDLKEKTAIKMSDTDCLFDINNLSSNSIIEFDNEKKGREELNKILQKFKKAEN